MKVLFADNGKHKALAPLTLTRPVADLRIGITTIAESWISLLNVIEFGYETEDYIQIKYEKINADIKLAGNIKPSKELAKLVLSLEENSSLYVNEEFVAQKGNGNTRINHDGVEMIVINHLWDIFENNHQAISLDFKRITEGRVSNKLNATNQTAGEHPIFVEEGASVNFSILNAVDGPIYIGKDAEIMEGSLVRGPFALCENATLKMGAKIYTGTTIGPYCKIGGEVSNSIFHGFSNKGHDGFLGNSIVGEWCNFGADSNTSNLKNNYGKVKLYNYETEQLEKTDVMFCGVIMGDHSKTGINTMLNTATSVGVSSNIFGGGFPPKHIASFSWGGRDESPKFMLEKAFEVAENMMSRRKKELTDVDKSILSHLYNLA